MSMLYCILYSWCWFDKVSCPCFIVFSAPDVGKLVVHIYCILYSWCRQARCSYFIVFSTHEDGKLVIHASLYSLLLTLAVCSPDNGMRCFLLLLSCLNLLLSARHIRLQLASVVIHITLWDDRKSANSFKFALASNLTLNSTGQDCEPYPLPLIHRRQQRLVI